MSLIFPLSCQNIISIGKDRRTSSNIWKLFLARQNSFWYSGFWFDRR